MHAICHFVSPLATMEATGVHIYGGGRSFAEWLQKGCESPIAASQIIPKFRSFKEQTLMMSHTVWGSEVLQSLSWVFPAHKGTVKVLVEAVVSGKQDWRVASLSRCTHVPIGGKIYSVPCDVDLAQRLPMIGLLASPRVKGSGQTMNKMEVIMHLIM